MNRFKISLVFFILVIFGLYFFKSSFFLDSDFGWHLRTGQIILSSGIPQNDPFSYTMPTYQYVDLPWLTDMVTAAVFPYTGLSGLAVVFSFLTLFAMGIVFAVEKKPTNIIFLSVFLLLALTFLTFVTVRPLVFTWVMFSLLLWIIWEKGRLEKWRPVIPLIFWFWASLHGGFAVGILVYGLVIVVRMVRQKNLLPADLFTLSVSSLITLINPYGIGLWHEVWLTIASQNLRSSIAEWQSTLTFFEPASIVLVALTLGLVWRYRKRFEPEKLVLFVCFFCLGVSAIRHVPLLALLCVPLFFEGSDYLVTDVKKIKHGMNRLNKAAGLFLGFCLVLTALYVGRTLWFGNQEMVYPVKAVEFLHENKPPGQIFAPYGWGGYLIWKLPEKKVFIDGRMANWSWQSPTYLESNSAFEEYMKIVNGDIDFRTVFDKYHVTTVLWYVQGENLTLDHLFGEKLNSLLGIKGPGKDLGQRLQENGWKEIYSDPIAVIYKKAGG